MKNWMIEATAKGEQGHATAGVGSLVPAIGAILLTIGVAGDTDWLIWVGGIVLAVGVVILSVTLHMGVDYDMYARLEKLEGK